MMKHLKLVFLICLSLFAVKNSGAQTNKETIDIKIPVRNFQSVRMSDIISEYTIIPLEFTKKSMIRAINKIVIHDDLIYILDILGTKNVLVFNMKGEYIRSISESGKGPGQLPYPMDFNIVPEENRIDIIGNKKINSFSLDGNLLYENTIEFNSSKFIKQGNNYYFSAPWTENCLLLKTTDKFKTPKKILIDKNKSDAGVSGYCPFLKTDSTYFTYWATTNDTIYLIDQNSAYPFRTIDFGKYKFDYDEYSKLSTEEKALKMMSRKKSKNCFLNRYFETKDHIHIHYTLEGKTYSYLLNKRTEKEAHYDQKNLIDDIAWLNIQDRLPALIGCGSEYFYYSIPPYKYKSTEALLKFLNSNPTGKKYSLKDVEKLSGNPIILIAKYDF